MKLFFRSALCLFCAAFFPCVGFLLCPEAVKEESEPVLVLLSDGSAVSMSEEDYLSGVLAGEMPASFPTEALKAQAVAARSYARRLQGQDKHPGGRICTRGSCCQCCLSEQERREKWGGDFERYESAVREAVRATEGELLCYKGAVIEACFHASSSLCTESSEEVWGRSVPYLVSVSSPESAETVPRFVSTLELSAAELRSLLGAEGSAEGIGLCVQDAAGRVESMELMGRRYGGAELRTALGLRSTAFSAEYSDGYYRFTVSGSGHGVGMSQYGARIFAEEGWDYRAILSHYYPGTELVRG